jgi:putative membrane protein
MNPSVNLPAANAAAAARFRTRYVLVLLVLFLAATVCSGIGAHYPQDWLLENSITLALLAPVFIWRKKLLPILSLTSWTFLFVYLCIHELGAHWTYSEVPYREWWAAFTGGALPPDGAAWAGRNHFDRLVHFLYGLLLTLPLRECITATSPLKRGFWSHFVPFDIIMSTSMLYELIEWLAAEIFGSELGQAYNGTQGDIWDPQKDMALATLGGFVAILAIWLVPKLMHKHKSPTAA